jgi:hypothetical protein
MISQHLHTPDGKPIQLGFLSLNLVTTMIFIDGEPEGFMSNNDTKIHLTEKGIRYLNLIKDNMHNLVETPNCYLYTATLLSKDQAKELWLRWGWLVETMDHMFRIIVDKRSRYSYGSKLILRDGEITFERSLRHAPILIMDYDHVDNADQDDILMDDKGENYTIIQS